MYIYKSIININIIYVGFFKKRIKSQTNPGVNAGNILRRQQACRYYNLLLEDKEGPKEDVDDKQ